MSERYFAQDKVVSHGYKISQCKDPELMMLFHFLILILHPRKPSYIPIKWANTVIASWSGEREINWAFIMHKVIQDEVRALGPKKLCYLPSYLAQFYAYGDCQLVIERHHKVLVRRVIKEVYGTLEDELTDEEEATYEETEEENTKVGDPPLKFLKAVERVKLVPNTTHRLGQGGILGLKAAFVSTLPLLDFFPTKI